MTFYLKPITLEYQRLLKQGRIFNNGKQSTHAPQNDCPRPGVATVTQAEFNAVDLEVPIHNSVTVDCLSLAEIYETTYNQHEKASKKTSARVFNLIFHILYMHFKPEDAAEPYGPLMQMNGKRSMIPSDLRGEQSDVLAMVASNVNNPGLRARLSDIAWINNRKRSDMARLAINAYCDAVQMLLGDEARFSQTSSRICGTEMLHRACQIAHKTGWKDSEGSRLKNLVLDTTQHAFDHKNYWEFIRAASLSLQFSIDDPKTLAEKVENLADTENPGTFIPRNLWKLAATAHRRCKNDVAYNRCRQSAAECLVVQADAYSGQGMGAAKNLLDAIQELRHIPNTQEMRQELEVKLREAQTSISDEMHTITTEVDLTQSAEVTINHVSGLSLAQALKVFALLDRSPDPEVLREHAQRQAKEYVLGPTYLTQPFGRGTLAGSMVEVSAGGEVQQTL